MPVPLLMVRMPCVGRGRPFDVWRFGSKGVLCGRCARGTLFGHQNQDSNQDSRNLCRLPPYGYYSDLKKKEHCEPLTGLAPW